MNNFLILVCNSTKAFIYSTDKQYPKKNLTLVTELTHPESREKGTDLVSDRPGHYQTSHKAGGAYEDKMTPKEHEKDHFAKQIADHLETLHKQQNLHQLTLITPSHFFGLLEKHFSKQVSESIHKVIQKDYATLTEAELRKHLQQDVLPPD